MLSLNMLLGLQILFLIIFFFILQFPSFYVISNEDQIFILYLKPIFFSFRVCVAEMAKKTATIMRSIAMLQVECSKNKTSLISLASYFKNLPMPHDYAVSENRFIVHEFL